MANWHVRAVLARRGEYQDGIDRDIMLAIATHIGNDDRPATVSLSTISELAGCHYNTAAKRTKRLQEDGKLIIEQTGKFLSYALPFDAGTLPGEGVNNKAVCKSEVEELKTIILALEKRVDDLHTIVTSSPHHPHIIPTSVQSDGVDKEVKKERSEEGIYAPSERKNGKPEFNAFRDYEPLEQVNERARYITAITTVCKGTFSDMNRDQYEAAAEALMRDGVTIQQIEAFGDWWKEHGFYKGKPVLKSLLSEIGNAATAPAEDAIERFLRGTGI